MRAESPPKPEKKNTQIRFQIKNQEMIPDQLLPWPKWFNQRSHVKKGTRNAYRLLDLAFVLMFLVFIIRGGWPAVEGGGGQGLLALRWK